jgi:membrane-anchored glycerophosphoryl diester phosphodiesterase (GDPDase)
MSTGKLIVLVVAWVLASITIGVVTGVLLTEILVLIGLVDAGSTEYSVILNIISLSVFVVVGSVPLVFRKRFESSEADNA